MTENIWLLGMILLVHLLGVASPGPDFIMTVRNSLAYSRQTGIFTAIGIGLGIIVHLTYCLLGLAVIISQSILLFNAIKMLGAGYLIYIGIKSWRARGSEIVIGDCHKKADISAAAAVKIGFLTNVLNPKATLFFLGLFTLVIQPNISKSLLAVASVIMVINTMLWFALVAIFFTQKHVRNVFERFQGYFNKFFGGLLVLLGVKVALAEK